MLRIASWNVNSVRARLPLLLKWLAELSPDIVLLQETKTIDSLFPHEAISDVYYNIALAGQKTYNGVAILSRHPLDNLQIHKRCGKSDARHISARVKAKGGSFELHNIYIPAGGYEPDPVANDKFQHKLDFVDELAAWFPKERSSKEGLTMS